MPNADTMGSRYREKLIELEKSATKKKIYLIENFGKEYYFNAMYYSEMIIGNSSSGIIEAASFNKYVLNIGNRQKGRSCGINVFHCPFNSDRIIESVLQLLNIPIAKMVNPYYKKDVVSRVIDILKSLK